MSLTAIQRYCEGEMTARFVRPPHANDSLVLTVPGGPGLGSRYLDPFLEELSRKTGLNVGLLDLPNHGDSVVSASKLPLSYEECLKLVSKAIVEIGAQTGGLFLFGQSFGARLVFDFLAASAQPIKGAIFAGFPYVFRNSSALTQKLENVELEAEDVIDLEEAFARNWRKILPHYLPRPLSPEVFQALASGTKWIGNEKMLEDAPAIESVAKCLSAKHALPRLVVFQGEFDEVVPDKNLAALMSLLPAAHFHKITGAGHFPMVEEMPKTLDAFSNFVAEVERPA